MSATIAAAQLRAFVERVERIEAEIADANKDKSEVYKELRGQGFDVKTVRKIVAKRKMEPTDREEQDALFDLYWEALHGSVSAQPSRVHVHEAKTPATATQSDITAQVRGGAATPPTAGTVVDGDDPLPEPGSDKGSGVIPHPPPTSSPAVDQPVEVNPPPASTGTLSDDDVPAFLKRREPVVEPNERCQRINANCKFSHHPQKITCATCGTAWAIARRKQSEAA